VFFDFNNFDQRVVSLSIVNSNIRKFGLFDFLSFVLIFLFLLGLFLLLTLFLSRGHGNV
jgi:hypothetical protein